MIPSAARPLVAATVTLAGCWSTAGSRPEDVVDLGDRLVPAYRVACDIPIGARGSAAPAAGDLERVRIPDSLVTGREVADLDAIAPLVAGSPLVEGQILVKGMFVDPALPGVPTFDEEVVPCAAR